MSDRRGCPKPRVLIIGQQKSFEHILTTNIQNWGYEARIVSASTTMQGTEAEGDILLFDLDKAHDISIVTEGAQTPAKEIRAPSYPSYLIGDEVRKKNRLQLPRARFTIVLSSQSVSRSTLEQIGAVALLQKPFEMGRLQRYLRVLQRLLLEPAITQPLDEKRRILVVDDDIAIANAVQQCLIFESGYEVAVAYDGLAALEQCLDWRPDCIVTDLIMPWMNGYQVMRCLNAVSLQTMPAFVIMSALNQFEVPWNRSYMRGNVVEYVDKPFNVDRLLSAIKQACIMHSA
jgi:CheY-like chemotaxis protein